MMNLGHRLSTGNASDLQKQRRWKGELILYMLFSTDGRAFYQVVAYFPSRFCFVSPFFVHGYFVVLFSFSSFVLLLEH